ncbi:MAG: Cna B-type domain-containing protein [Oscillospiraceae bacterium]|nr:Cna B-type domain-containing protein [Oscillospiraceae bacterium]
MALNDYKDEFMSSTKTITLKDILDANITDKTAFAAIFGDSGVKALSSSDFTDGKYTVSYVTAVPDSYKNSAVNKTLSNKAEITYETGNTKSAETSVTIPGSIGEFVTKSCALDENGNIKWTVAIDIPNVNNISRIEIGDYMDVSSSFITDSTEFTVIDCNNNTHALSEVGSRGWYSNQQFQISITNTTFINNNRNDTIKLVYTTPTNSVSKVTNTATAKILFKDDTSASDSDSAVYALPGTKEAYYLDKIGFSGKESLKGAMAWHISVTKSDSYAAGDVITVKDTLPEGLEYVSGSLAINPANPYWFDPNNAYKNCVSVSAAGREMTITITVSAALAEALNKSESKAIDIAYITQMTDAEYLSWLIGGTAKGYTNNAKISINSGSEFPVTPAKQFLTPESTDIVSKFVSGTQKPTTGDTNYYATYTVKINEEALTLNSGNTFIAEDSLGSRLEYVDNSFTVTPSDGVSFSYDNVNNKISISNLQDATAYTINYKVKVNQIYLSDSYSDAEIGNMFGNTIAVTLDGTNRIGSSTCLDEGTYRSKGDYSFNQSGYTLTIKGTKAWASDSSSIRPSKIRIKLEVKKYVTENSQGAVETQKETSTKEYTITPNVQPDGSWAYTIDDLPLYLDSNTDGKIRYSYTVSEVKIDGYEASYQLDSTNSTNISTLSVSANGNPNEITIGDTKTADAVCTLDITNTFTAENTEKGKLTVNKSWQNETGSSIRPADITFTLTDEENNTQTATMVSTETSVEFKDLPLFTYSRSTDSSGNEILVRTPRRYTLTEAPVSGYTTTYSERTFTLTDSASNTTNINKNVTVVNSYNTVPTTVTPEDIKIIKTINGKNSSIAESAKFTLYGSDMNTEITTAHPTPSTNGKYNVIFSGSSLSVDTTYYVAETTSATGCDISRTKYKCRIDSDGTVMYSIDGSNFESATIPTCDNTAQPHDVSLIKIYQTAEGNTLTPTPEEILATEFTLADTAPGSNIRVTKSPTFDGSDYIVTFTEADGVKSGRTYIITESSSPDTYTSSNIVYYCMIDDAGSVSYSTDLNGTPSAPPTFINIQNSVSVTIEPIKLIKKYTAEDNTDSAPSESERIETKFTLSDTDPASGFADVTRFPVLVGGEYVVTFTEADGLQKGSTYMLRETGSPDTFTASDAVYYCRIDADGKVSYSTDINGTYSDTFIPSFTNVRIDSSGGNVTPGAIQLIKTYRTAEGTDVAPTEDILRSTVFTLTCADDSTFIRTASPVWDGSRATVTFSEGLAAGKTYLLRETSAPEGYTAGSLTYYCRIDEFTGYASYSTDGVNYSADFPVCVNVRNGSDEPPVPGAPDPSYPNYPDYPYYPTYPYEPVYPPYYPVEEVPPFILYPEIPDNSEDVSSGAGITDIAEEGSSDIGAIALTVFFSSLIATTAAGIFRKKKHNR